MGEDTQHAVESGTFDERTSKQRFMIFIVVSILTALVLVVVSMSLYATSGTAQLDLSRPGYQSVQDKLGPTDTFQSFPASGPVNNQTIEQFKNLYNKQVKPVEGDSPFGAEPLSDHSLGIDAPTASQLTN